MQRQAIRTALEWEDGFVVRETRHNELGEPFFHFVFDDNHKPFKTRGEAQEKIAQLQKEIELLVAKEKS